MPLPGSTLKHSSLPLLNILENQLLPLWEQGGMERCLIAPHDLNDERVLQKWLSTGATISPSPYKGKRRAVKGPRNYGNRNTNLAHWPEDGLQERSTSTIACVIRGSTDFQIGDQMVHCTAGHSLLILPGTPRPDGSASHLDGANRKNGFCDLLWIGGEVDAGIGCWVCHSEGERHFERPGESCHIPDQSVMSLLGCFLQEATNQYGDYRAICQNLFHSLLMTICRDIREERIFLFSRQKPEELPSQPHQNPIEAAQEYMKNHLHEPLLINDVARRFHFSRTEFVRHFREQTGQTFNQYLTEARLAEARRLLSATAWSIEMVGKAVSFKSSRLRVLFNRHYGMSPHQYRKQCRAEVASHTALKNKRQKKTDRDGE